MFFDNFVNINIFIYGNKINGAQYFNDLLQDSM